MAVDVSTSIEIERPRDEVAAYAMDPAHATAWYKNIKSVETLTPGPLGIGTKLAFEAQFLGRQLRYTYEVVALEPSSKLVMRTADGPFLMETTYIFADLPNGGTAMTLRNRGEPTGFSRFVAPLMRPAMRRANRQDLDRLRAIAQATA